MGVSVAGALALVLGPTVLATANDGTSELDSVVTTEEQLTEPAVEDTTPDSAPADEVVATVPEQEVVTTSEPEAQIASEPAPVEDTDTPKPQANSPPAKEKVAETKKPKPEVLKDWHCKYVGTPGVDERLKTGNEGLVWVDGSAAQGSYFNDAQGRSYVLLADAPHDPKPDASLCPTPENDPTPYVIVAWAMPGWINETTPVWEPGGQTFAESLDLATKDLSALDSWLSEQEYGCFQIDGYLDNDTTASLIEGGVLYGPNNPKESHWGGGWGEAYKLVRVGNSCEEPEEPPTDELIVEKGDECVAAGGSVVKFTNPASNGDFMTVSYAGDPNGQPDGSLVLQAGETKSVTSTHTTLYYGYTFGDDGYGYGEGSIELEQDCAPPPVEASVEITVDQAVCVAPGEVEGGSFEYVVTVGSTEPARNFQVKSLGDGTGGSAETYYRADGTTGAPGEVITFVTVQPGETATLSLDNLPAGDYRVTSDGTQKVKSFYKRDFTINEVDCEEPPTEAENEFLFTVDKCDDTRIDPNGVVTFTFTNTDDETDLSVTPSITGGDAEGYNSFEESFGEVADGQSATIELNNLWYGDYTVQLIIGDKLVKEITFQVVACELPQPDYEDITAMPGCGYVDFTNPNEVDVTVQYGSFEEELPDGEVVIQAGETGRVLTDRTQLDYVSFTEDEYSTGSGSIAVQQDCDVPPEEPPTEEPPVKEPPTWEKPTPKPEIPTRVDGDNGQLVIQDSVSGIAPVMGGVLGIALAILAMAAVGAVRKARRREAQV